MENELPPRHHPDIRWAIIISCVTTALLVLVVAYGWNNMKKLEMEATYNKTNTEITAENEKKINTMEEEVNGLKNIIANLKIEIDNYQKDLDEAKRVTSTAVVVTTTSSILPQK